MDKSYEPADIEARWIAQWQAAGYASPDHASARHDSGKAFAVMIPPPNVTGTLHMGHAFQHSIMDALTRYHRMLGDDTLWLPGSDHAGIATQMVVERQLVTQGESRLELGRQAFLQRVWQWKEESGGTIANQIRRMGNSVDWSRDRFTMDEAYSQAVSEHFVRLYKDGLIYRGLKLVNWDPKLGTAISDLEVENHDENGHLWHFRYPLADGSGHVIVATTRPETMLGDAAVAVHPDDERYQGLIGKCVRLPLTGREIPIIADTYVDPAFGTGCVKITPAHDFNDYAVGQRHDLPQLNIFTPDAHLNSNAPEAYRGLERFAARKRIVEDMDAQGLLEKTEPHKMVVPRGDRSGEIIEPYLTWQWFVRMEPLAKRAIEVVERGELKFVPDNWKNTYFQWLRNIQDWCISRQLWWGHRIPAWYDEDGNVYIGTSEAEVRKHYADSLPATATLRQDDDVFDTWFSSALWPFATLGWPDNSRDLERFYPNSVLVTGFDIIFFWVARMIVAGLHFMDEIPFPEVYVHGLIRDSQGQKMSKSKGNVLDPLDLVDGISLDALLAKRTGKLMQPQMAKKIEAATRKEFPNGIQAVGVDALRFTFLALASPGRDIRFDASRAEGYRNFCNKLWNAARFVLMHCEDQDCGLADAGVELSVADRWIRSRLQAVAAEAAQHFASYRFDLLAQSLYQFVWNEYCDWYLELAKPVLQAGSAAQQRGTRQTLLAVLEATLRLLHPLMPFITEEVWQRVAPLAGQHGESIMQAAYPQADASAADTDAEQAVAWIQAVVLGLRQIRGEMDIAPGKPLPVLVSDASATEREALAQHDALLRFMARVSEFTALEAADTAPQSATALVGRMKLLVPMAGLIDKQAELTRLGKQISERQAQIQRAQGKLGNAQFIERAPAAVVEKEHRQLAEHEQALSELLTQRQRIESL